MEVPHSKDPASHADLESCAAHREVRREALTEARTGASASEESGMKRGQEKELGNAGADINSS